jgi:hypothetical protein
MEGRESTHNRASAAEIKNGYMIGIYLSEPFLRFVAEGLITQITLSGATVKQIRRPKIGRAENIAQNGARHAAALCLVARG